MRHLYPIFSVYVCGGSSGGDFTAETHSPAAAKHFPVKFKRRISRLYKSINNNPVLLVGTGGAADLHRLLITCFLLVIFLSTEAIPGLVWSGLAFRLAMILSWRRTKV